MTIGRPEIRRDKPGLFLFLLDESQSMGKPFRGSGHSKAQALALTVNKAIENLILNCMPRGEVEDYYHIGAIGYGGQQARLAFEGALEGICPVPTSRLAANPLKMVKRTTKTGEIDVPVWIEPRSAGKTPMNAALAAATQVAADWVNDFADSIPPIVLNLTDGVASDGDIRETAKVLRAVSTKHGNTMLFNLHLTAARQEPVLYPASAEHLPSAFAENLFDISSELPAYMATMARALGIEVRSGSRGYVLNGDMVSLVQFLTIGTTPAPR